VPLNSTVSITVTSATSQEFHLHGYDLEKAGTKVTFTADQPGDFELESHATEKVLFVLTVSA
jgi:hypothetical protein